MPLNIADIEKTHQELEARLHMLTNQDGGRAHRHRGVLIEILKEERSKSGVGAAMKEIAELKAAMAETNTKLEQARLAILERDQELATLRAQIAGARRNLPPAPPPKKEVAPAEPSFRDAVVESAPAPVAPRGSSRLPQADDELIDDLPQAVPAPPLEVRKDGTPAFKPCMSCQDVMRCARSNHCPLGQAPQLSDDD